MNNAGTMIMEVADLSAMIVKARVDEASIAQVKEGQRARVRMEAYREKTFDGTVSNVALANFDPNLSRGSMSRSSGMMDGGKYFKVEILLKTEGQRIFSGLSADVDIETNRHENIVKVPSQAVVGRLLDSLPTDIRNRPEVDAKKTMVPVVYRVINEEAVATPVVIGASDFTHTVIKAGLKSGEPVITGPYKVLETVQHAQKVKSDRPTSQPSSQPATTQSTSQPSSRPTTEPAITQTTPNRNS
jgi:HlyD family secretion protein